MSPTQPARPLRQIAFAVGPLGCLCAVAVAWTKGAPSPLSPEALVVAGVTVWMAVWWIFEVVPIAATSMLPLALFPLLGIVNMKTVAASYMHHIVVLLMTGFMVALAIERWALHKRVALAVLLRVGTSPRRLILGMMIASAVCSMWISNTATTLVMLPIGVALVARARTRVGDDPAAVAPFATALFLGIAYAANVGGMGTPIGTPPNVVFLGIYEQVFPDRDPITFLGWMGMAVPLVVVFIPLIWLVLTRRAHRVEDSLDMGSHALLVEEAESQGAMNRDQRSVALVFGLMALAWITRQIKLGDGQLVGWAPALGLDSWVEDATVASAAALLLFAWPASTEKGKKLLDWQTARRLPWDVLLLLGGGFALAAAFQQSGLSEAVAHSMAGLEHLPVWIFVAVIALGVTFLTEVTSNTATTTVLMPILAAFAAATGLSPELVMIPAVLSASCAFMLPVATAPNAIVYGTGEIPISSMARVGVMINLMGAALITLWLCLRF